VASRLVFNNKTLAILAIQLFTARLFCVEVVEAGLPGNYFSISGDLQSLGI
jgi:hypothetical protein